MPVVEQVTLTHEQLTSISNRMFNLVSHNLAQGTLEWMLFRAVGDELGVNLFELRPNECSCGDKKDPSATVCAGCAKYA